MLPLPLVLPLVLPLASPPVLPPLRLEADWYQRSNKTRMIDIADQDKKAKLPKIHCGENILLVLPLTPQLALPLALETIRHETYVEQTCRNIVKLQARKKRLAEIHFSENNPLVLPLLLPLVPAGSNDSAATVALQIQ